MTRRRPPQPDRLYWICQVAGWASFMGYVLGAYLVFSEIWETTDFINILVFTAVVSPLTSHAIRRWLWMSGWIEMSAGRLIPRLAGLTLTWAAAMTLLTAAGLLVMQGAVPPTAAQFSISLGYAWAMSGWLLIYMSVHARRRREAMAAVARDAQLRALRAQLNPHFLFNSLNSVRALIAEDPEKATAMVTGLADILRYSLASDRSDTVTLAEELDAVNEYLNLERVRFEERLHVERAVEASALRARIPPMLVQTLVENAVKHGIASLKAGGVIRLAASVRVDRLEVTVSNSGRYLPPTSGSGHGLVNASERLALLYGAAASLRVAGTEGGETVALLTLPLEIA